MLYFHAGHSPSSLFIGRGKSASPELPQCLHSFCTFLPSHQNFQNSLCPKGLLAGNVRAFSPFFSLTLGERDYKRKPSQSFPGGKAQFSCRAGPDCVLYGDPNRNLRTHRGDSQVISHQYPSAGLMFSCCLDFKFHMCLVILLYVSCLCKTRACEGKPLTLARPAQCWHVWHGLLLQLCLHTSVLWPLALQILGQIWSCVSTRSTN